MFHVKFKNTDAEIFAPEGTSIAECVRKAGLSMETPCGCVGICGKCKVRVKGSLNEISPEEMQFIEIEKDERLSCLAKVKGDIEIELMKYNKELKTINRGCTKEVLVNTDIKIVNLGKPDYESSRPFLEKFDYEITSPQIYEKLTECGCMDCENIDGIVFNNTLIDIGENLKVVLGAAVDIGTTGISAYLINLLDGEILSSVSCLNPQTEYGGDVLSRITFCINNTDGSKILRSSIINKINELLVELTGGSFSKDNIYRVTISGNTIMLHMFLGIDTVTIAKAPYRPVFLNTQNLSASKTGLEINSNGIVTLLPSASGYVGSDIISGVVAASFYNKKRNALFIDIGTNGEIVLISRGKMSAASTAAGPALEGMNISCGSRAAQGAIDSFNIDEDYNISYTTIGDAFPSGICGSGLIDIAACFVEREIILLNGRFNNSLNEKIKDRLKDKKFYINNDIYLSQKDIRQIQLAKGAIAAGVAMLISEMGILIEDIDEVVVAGAFGYHINPSSIQRIGLIPKGFRGSITFVGNSSLEGARLALINRDSLRSMEEIKSEIDVLELSMKEEFQTYFVRELSF